MQDQAKDNVRKSIVRIAPQIFCNHPVLFAYLYGSFATGYVHPFSDIDIAVFTEKVASAKILGLELMLSLKFDQKLNCRSKSEVRVINNLPLVIKGQILTSGRLIFSANEVERVDFETRVRSAYFDFLPVIQNYQSVYLD